VDACSESRPELTQRAGRSQVSAVPGDSSASIAARGAPITSVACHRPLHAPAAVA
jgi:hypothetical protein